MTQETQNQTESIMGETPESTPSNAEQFKKWRSGRRKRFWWYMAAHGAAVLCLIIGGSMAVSKQALKPSNESTKTVATDSPTATKKDVQDHAGILDQTTESRIAAYNEAFKALPDAPALLVVTIDELPDDESLESYTLKTAEDVGVGEEGKDNGIVYLIAVDERKARMEVGYGLEGTVTDAAADDITDDTVKDHYRDGDYDAGVTRVLANLGKTLNDGKTLTVENAPPIEDKADAEDWWVWPAVAIIASWFFWVPIKIGAYIGWQARYRGMVRDYELALRKIVPNFRQAGDPRFQREINGAKEALKASYNGQIKPDWYDLAVAFGTVTWWQFMRADRSLYQTTVVNRHTDDWYKPSRGGWGILSAPFTGFGGSGGSSGGGGGFGGGGASSGW